MSENTEKIQENSKFQKGQSGNPNGRPLGARNKATLMAEQLFSMDVQEICESIITHAKLGNMQAAKIILDRLLPPIKHASIKINLPKIKKPSDILTTIGKITEHVAAGEISPSDGEALARIIDIQAKAYELYEFERRLTALEEKKTDETI